MRSEPASVSRDRRRSRSRLPLGIVAVFLVGVLIAVLLASPSFRCSGGFSDVPEDHPYRAGILDLSSRKVLTGFEDGTFRPDDPVIRQQFAKMIVKALGYPVSTGDLSPFSDVPPSRPGDYLDPADPHYPDHYVAVCASQGITVGVAPTLFAPYDGITRQQLITMLARAARLADPPDEFAPPFSPDAFYPKDHYVNARKAAFAGLLDGLQGIDSQYDFQTDSTRGECAQLLYNLLDFLESESAEAAPAEAARLPSGGRMSPV